MTLYSGVKNRGRENFITGRIHMLLGRKRWHEHKASKKSIFISDKTLIHCNHRDYGHDANRIGSAMYVHTTEVNI